MHWLHSFVAASGHDPVRFVIALGAYRASIKLSWWLTAMRVAITSADEKAVRARKAIEAIEPHWHWL